MCSFIRLIPLVTLALLPAFPSSAQITADPSGHWVGTIQAPGMEVAVEIDLIKNSKGALAGTFSQPSERIQGLPLTTVTAEGRSVRLVLKPGTGGGTFSGSLSADNTAMTGDFTTDEGGYMLAFSLTRRGEAKIAAAPKSPPIDKTLEGAWQGPLDVAGKPMRLVVTMVNHADGTATGTVVSPDGSGVEIPIAMTQQAASVRLDAPSIGASFAGVLDAAAGEVTGAWTQGAGSLPLTLRRVAK